MTDEIRAEIAALRSHLAALHTKSDIAIRVLLHLMGHTDMSIHDDILSALSTNDAALVAVGAKVDSLIAEKAASDTVFSDVLPRLQAQGSAVAALDAKIAGALPAQVAPGSAQGTSGDAGSIGVSGAVAAPAADASTAPAPIGTVIPGVTG